MGGIAEVLGCLQGEACFYILIQGMTEIRQKCIRGLLLLNAYKWIVIMMPNFSTVKSRYFGKLSQKLSSLAQPLNDEISN